MSYHNEYFIRSKPLKIIWAGFESDTFTLQKNGWTLAIEDRSDHLFDRHEIRFILKHELLQLICVSNFNTMYFEDFAGFYREHPEEIRFSIAAIAKNVFYASLPEFRMEDITEIDCQPEYTKITHKNLDELSIFKTLIKPDNALIVQPEKISEILQQIVDAQAPNQREIRERMRRSNERSGLKQTLHAQILTVAA